MSRRFEGNTFLFRTRIGEDGVKQEGNNQFADATQQQTLSATTPGRTVDEAPRGRQLMQPSSPGGRASQYKFLFIQVVVYRLV